MTCAGAGAVPAHGPTRIRENPDRRSRERQSIPDINRRHKDLIHWANAEKHVMDSLKDIRIVVKNAEIWDTFLEQLLKKDDTRPP
ncbi:hypothetical protein NDU88_000939 [Pleurodeles waltl]|uniref:Uncharacterized protein n=1 Tax=Pleurodeles waltl TaxID=8319 RepID=A0AAV7TIQ0_PLEWA|nr:hypothetical protein NDU88_000939 [Pleurodeles waltl]